MKGLNLVATLVAILGVGFIIFRDYKQDGCIPGLESHMAPSNDRVEADVVGKTILVKEGGQSWFIGNDQKVSFKPIGYRVVQRGQVSIYGNLNASTEAGAVVGLKDTKPKEGKLSVESLVRVDYEKVGDQWRLATMTPFETKLNVH